jgi:alcohol dehydrogenase class IV
VKAPPTLSLARTVADSLAAHSLQVEIYDGIDRKPTLSMFQTALAAAKSASPDAIVGLGGGSPLDVAKLIPAFLNREQRVEDAYGIDLLTGLYERAF